MLFGSMTFGGTGSPIFDAPSTRIDFFGNENVVIVHLLFSVVQSGSGVT